MSTTTTVPDGKGGWREQEATEISGRAADQERQQVALKEQWLKESVGLIEWLWKQGRVYQSEHGLSKEQVAFAVALHLVNCRQNYPAGPAEFDKMHEKAWDYYQSATGKAG